MRRYIGAEPEIGDKRAFVVFAWFPKKTDDGYLIWLENYLSLREYNFWGGYGVNESPKIEWSEYHSKVID